eukprot:TRINITY_DN10576_c0_g1_i3.p2 TRINITY_DN10576_c0_g1~~TRINITY_DN10576_c0_g1_i3.p2  ORF type:complete len:313 (+),score=74.80 TRINITY_DN10576_c0_g1_i3:1078-2016(+)
MAAPLHAAPQPAAPVSFWEVRPDQLQLREKVGQGITAVVHRARLGPEGRLVAVKLMSWNKSTVANEQMKAIHRELSIMTRVSHENLVNFIGVMSMQSPFSIITEFCAGGCLFHFLYNHRGDPDEVDLCWPMQKKMALDVASAMHYLHAFDPQIIHRDLKSLNLLLMQPVLSSDAVPHLKVADFGLSRMKDSAPDTGWQKMTMAAGTSFWMAPEVVRGTSYDEKVDVYSFSMVLFEIISREIPFEDENPARVGALTLAGKRPDLEAVPEDCPSILRELMIRCWDQDPAARPAFNEILETILALPLPLPMAPAA